MDGIASIQARIAEIQSRFVATPASTQPLGADPSAASAALSMGLTGTNDSSDFASMLASATAGQSTTPSVSGTTKTQAFLSAALGQAGDPYVWGASAAPDDANPGAFDCSELTKWAANRVGIDLPDGSWLQYLKLKQQGALVPVQQALQTPGALLFSFSEEPTPGGGRPSHAHVAISLGDGKTIEARGKKYGVNTFDAGNRFQYGAIIPGL
jgi:cell wall-associated NlpC family hydrolase